MQYTILQITETGFLAENTQTGAQLELNFAEFKKTDDHPNAVGQVGFLQKQGRWWSWGLLSQPAPVEGPISPPI
jgi:hypothetical protein